MASLRENASKGANPTTWAVLYRMGGKQTSKTFTTEKAASDFKTLVDMLGPEKALTTLAAPAVGITVDDLAERFFAWKSDAVTPRTLADYRRDYANWIQPALGHRAADTVDERDVQALVDKMAKQLDPKSVKDKHMVLGSMYRYGSAKSRRIVEGNPCLETELPRRKKKPVKGATMPEWFAVYDAAQRVDPDAADVLLFIISTGWRWSEVTPLTVASIEDYGDEVYVSVRRVMRRDAEAKFIVAEDEAKSFAGIRRVRVGQLAAGMLRRRVIGKGPADLVFTNRHGRRWHQTNFLNRTWTDILEAAGIQRRFTPHALRHTHVALLDRSGASLPEIQRRIGHDQITTTIGTYGGMIDGVSGDTIDALDMLLTPPNTIEGQVVRGELSP